MCLRINGCRVKLKALVNNGNDVNLLHNRFLVKAKKIPVLNGGYLAWLDTKKRMFTLKDIKIRFWNIKWRFPVTTKKVKIISLKIIKKFIYILRLKFKF
ncbi:hypothetical protein GGTG_08976 [Gaeumannomyces tritici R3-111a-1]|uniref:Uncharacterized protein n=1 Tax=Gaeumannomyces tritici (strain R3-111a-1) TaxID=644352 RepID=J3P635_GAET3|nr:hypothetical protein GGTG_08976 [Gaeumannomyces tritici R3-111a-1]EJT75138.1 hypothetical protein GGTG_08976 [Gaeumannomyces tritici R3-111a-1]